jgi:hypothetical protein
MHILRFILAFLSLIAATPLSFADDETYTSRVIEMAFSDGRIVYPSEEQFNLVLSWIDETIDLNENQTYFEKDGHLVLNEFTAYKYGLSQHSFVSVFVDGQDKYGYHMKLFIADFLNSDNRVLFLFDNSGGYKRDSLIACYLIEHHAITEFKELAIRLQAIGLPYVDTLDNPPFSIQGGKVEMNYFGYEAVDSSGQAINPYSYGAKIRKEVKTHLTWSEKALVCRTENLY